MKSENRKIRFIDLFAGAGGLSEGFIRQGFEPVAHVEMDKAACNTLRTRTTYHYLRKTEKFNLYIDYLKSRITRKKLYSYLPEELKDSVINLAIGKENNEQIFSRIDKLKGNEPIDRSTARRTRPRGAAWRTCLTPTPSRNSACRARRSTRPKAMPPGRS